MFVRQLIGRQANMIVEMPFAEAKANVENGTAKYVTDEEIAEAGHQPEASGEEVPADVLIKGYRIEPAESEGFDLFDTGGVPVNKDFTYHNHIAAREAAVEHARAMRGLLPVADNVDGTQQSGSNQVVYAKMTNDDLDALAKSRGIDTSSSKKKADYIELLERDDAVQAAIAAHNFDEISVVELKAFAAKDGIEIAEGETEVEILAKIKAKYPQV